MSADVGGATWSPLKDFANVFQQQGRLARDTDFNEFAAIVDRRLRAAAADLGSSGVTPGIQGTAVVPATTPDAFRITPSGPGGSTLTIGPGRLYVDGIAAENHGDLTDPAALRDDGLLGEPVGPAVPLVAYATQPHLPEPPNLPTGPDPHLVYLDVWNREVTAVEDPTLIDPALAVDTTTRSQTVWQVRVLDGVLADTTPGQPDAAIPGWADLIAPSAGRLTTASITVDTAPGACILPPSGGYRGLENQTYRVEVHEGGALGTATFVWSRENASVVTAIDSVLSPTPTGQTRIVPASLGRDQATLAFTDGDWVEITDDHRELAQLAGELRTIAIDQSTRVVTLQGAALPADLIMAPADARARHLRMRRWDQKGVIQADDGSTVVDLTAAGATGAIPTSPATRIVLENGLTVEFAVQGAGGFRVGDHWIFTARAGVADPEKLTSAPPLGIRHHYARLAAWTPSTKEVVDWRIAWPSQCGCGGGGECTVTVTPDQHNSGAFTIQQAVAEVHDAGGTVCLTTGAYRVDAPVTIRKAKGVRVHGQGIATLISAPEGAFAVATSAGIELADFAVVDAVAGAAIGIATSLEATVSGVVVLAADPRDGAQVTGVALSGVNIDTRIAQCQLIADTCVSLGGSGVLGTKAPSYDLVARLAVTDNILIANLGAAVAGGAAYLLHNEVARNDIFSAAGAGLALGGLQAADGAFAVRDNDVNGAFRSVSVTGGGFQVSDNVVVGGDPGDGAANLIGVVVADSWFAPSGAPTTVDGNRITHVGGFGICLDTDAGAVDVTGNTLQGIQGIGIGTTIGTVLDRVRVVGNTIDGVDRYQGTYIGPTGIQLLRVQQVVVAGNTVANVSTATERSATPTGVLIVGCGQTSVDANRLDGIGYTGDGLDGGIGIQLVGASDVSVTGNDVPFGAVANRVNWVGLVLDSPDALGKLNVDRGALLSFATAAFARRSEFAKLSLHVSPALRGIDSPIVFTPGGIIAPAAAGGSQSLIVTGNELTGGPAASSAVVDAPAADLLFADNTCSTTRTTGDTMERDPSAGLHANVSTLRVNANLLRDGVLALRLQNDLTRVAILGNVMNPNSAWGGGTGGMALPAPWDVLNVYL